MKMQERNRSKLLKQSPKQHAQLQHYFYLPLDHQIRLLNDIIKAEALGNVAQGGTSIPDFRNFTTACLACMATAKYLSTSQHPRGERKCCNYYLIAGELKYRENKWLAQSPIVKAVPFLTLGKCPEDRVSFLSRITLSHEAIAGFAKKTKQLFSSQYAEWMWVYFLRPIPILTESTIAKFWNWKEFQHTVT